MRKRIAILGSTGSIGTQALDVIRNNRDKFEVVALSCGSNVELLAGQVEEFRPLAVYVDNKELLANSRFSTLKKAGRADTNAEADRAGTEAEADRAGTEAEVDQAGTEAEVDQAGTEAEAGRAGTNAEAGRIGTNAEAGRAGTNAEAGRIGTTAEADRAGTEAWAEVTVCDSIVDVATMPEADIVLNSMMGMRGLEPTLAAIEAGKDIAFANKETLVVGGELVMNAVKRHGVKLLPVDSEHSAIFQALQGNGGNPVKRIVLTASGGPFRGYSREQLEKVTPAQALKHPNWSMGSKITIDSATMMNKGLEIIEARWLFDVPVEKIQVVVHPQSVLHSAVEYEDGSVMGQMGCPDMRVPIGYAFSYPERLDLTETSGVRSLDFFSLQQGMTFYPADENVFRTIALAKMAVKKGGSYPVVLNGANEVLVDMFLQGQIGFTDIQDTLEKIMNEHEPEFNLNLEDVLETDRKARELVHSMFRA